MKALENRLRERTLEQRAQPGSKPMPPTIVAFEPAPTYMLGDSYTQDPRTVPLYKRLLPQDRRLARFKLDGPQYMALTTTQETHSWDSTPPEDSVDGKPALKKHTCTPDLEASSRPTSTYLGPGQAVIWPVLDLRYPFLPARSKRGIENWIAKITIAWLKRKWGLSNVRERAGSGLWIPSSYFKEPRQIADIDVRVEDDIATSGLTMNVDVPVRGPIEVNPAARMKTAQLDFHPMTSVAVEKGMLGHELAKQRDILWLLKVTDQVAYDMHRSIGAPWPTKFENHSTILGDDWESLFGSGGGGGGVWIPIFIPFWDF